MVSTTIKKRQCMRLFLMHGLTNTKSFRTLISIGQPPFWGLGESSISDYYRM